MLGEAYGLAVRKGVGKMYRLVIVDDEVKILDGIAEIFPWHNIGFQVAARFTSARAALKYLEQERADVVMTVTLSSLYLQ